MAHLDFDLLSMLSKAFLVSLGTASLMLNADFSNLK